LNQKSKTSEPEIAEKLLRAIRSYATQNFSFMEVCGTHTVAIFRSGIRSVLPKNLRIISGPGCPVCVTPMKEIDEAIYLVKNSNTILATFGDLMKVPGNECSLLEARARGAKVKIILSPMDAVQLAELEKGSKVVLFAVGFETTIPAIAVAIKEAFRRELKNFFVLSSLRLIPPAIESLLNSKKTAIDGFILPGHVSVIIGTKPYQFIAEKYNTPGVVTGFEPLDILQGLVLLLRQKTESRSKIEIQYQRAVSPEGNKKAVETMYEVFEVTDSQWRGIGTIPKSGLALKDKYSSMDARKFFDIPEMSAEEPAGCICGEILQGLKLPPQCKLFGKRCTPEDPVGPCMVSSEGSCAAFYKYGK